LTWRIRTGQPLGFSGREYENESSALEGVFDDVGRDVRVLLTAANERVPGDALTSPPLTELEEAVLQLVPRGHGDGISGKEIIAAINKSRPSVGQSTLTTHIMPKLKKWYGVANRNGVGYYRL
jgi:hypothetical protein